MFFLSGSFNWNWSEGAVVQKHFSDFAPKMSPKYRTRLTRIKSVLFSNSSNSTSCRTNSDMSDPCQELSLWVSPFAVMDCRSWVMICQRREILIFPELHQVMPYCHRLLEILIAIICCCWWPQWDRGCLVDLGDNLLHHIVLWPILKW